MLIPRPETEILTDLVSSSLVKLPSKTSVKALDLCSGSGAIAIALKKKHPWLQVCAGDISAQALAVARLNGQKNAVQIDFREGDLLTPFDDCKFDLVVCNPPYISKPVYDALSFEVKDFEPREALLGGETGLEFYLKLEQQLPRFLNENAVIWFEIGYDQGEALMSIFRALNGWKSCRLIKDFAGHDRFFTCSN